jgi:hypothetical protein
LAADAAPVGVDPARFAVLAGALAARPVELRWSDTGSAYSDGRTIFVVPGALEEVRRQVVVQACLVGGGTLGAEIVARLAARPRVCARYFAVEAHRVLHRCAPSLPGLGVARWWDGPRPPLSSGPEESFRLARGHDPLPAAPLSWGEVRPGAVLRRGGEHIPALSDAPPRKAGEVARGDQRAGGESSGREHDPEFQNPLARFMRKLGDAFRAGSEGGQGEGAPSLETVGSRRPPGAGARLQRGEDLPPVAVPIEPGSVLYPEWDASRNRYRPNWCGVVEVDPPGGAAADPVVPPRDVVFERALARLSLGVARSRGETVGDDIWLDGLIRSRVARRAGDVPYERIYVANRWLRRDLAVLVLVDISGSVGDETSSGTSIHARQVALTHTLVGTLDALGDRVAAYGFHSEGRRNVQLQLIKGFEERFDGRARGRLGALRPAAFTRLGAAVRHATRLLHQGAGTPWRLLVVLSDGLPYDDGYEGSYAEADTRRAIGEARRSGAGCLCLGLGPHNPTLQRVFGTATYAASDDPVAIRAELVRLIRPALAGAVRPA